MDNKSAGGYVVLGGKEARNYLLHHFSKFFLLWIIKLAEIVGSVTIFMMPVVQRFNIEMCRHIDDSGEAVLSKCFDQTDHKKGYRSLLFFDVLWVIFTLAGIAAIIALAYYIREIILSIMFYFNGGVLDQGIYEFATHMKDGFANVASDWTMYIFIPFLVLAVVYLLYAIFVMQAASHIASKNPNLGLGDLAYNAFAALKDFGGKLFWMNVLYLIEVVTLVAIVIAPPMIFSVIYENLEMDYYTYNFIVWIFYAVISAVYLFVIPYFLLSYEISVFKIFEDNAAAEKMVVAYRKNDTESKDKAFISMTPVDDPSGNVTYINLDEEKSNKKEGDN